MRVAIKTREQCRQAGVGSLAELKSQVTAKRIAAMGWPSDLWWQEAKILSLIWDRGPMTRREIAETLGDFRGKRAFRTKDRGGTFLATLQRRGLLVVIKKGVKGKGKGRSCDLYTLNPFTIQRRKAAAC